MVAQPIAAPQTNTQHPGENGEMLEPAKAVAWTLTYNSDFNVNLYGGDRTGTAYLQRVGLIADVNLQPLFGWHGAKFHASVHAINGQGLSSADVGNILTVSGLEAEPALRLFNLWIEQALGGGASLRIGQFTAAQEFMISKTSSLFVNSTFGWPGSFATDLPSGGPAYPLAAPGARLALVDADGTVARVAIFAGDPAGPGFGDSQQRDQHGFNGFRFKGSPFLIAEINHMIGHNEPRLNLVVGGWIHFDRFDDLNGGRPHSGNYSTYAIADARLWASSQRSLYGFIRGSASPADRNPLDLYADAGFTLLAPFDGRPNDSVGIAIGLARLSPRLRSLVRRRAALAGVPDWPPAAEGVIELSYQLKISSRAYLQPDAQWIIHPAGWVLSGRVGLARQKERALVVGLRSSLTL